MAKEQTLDNLWLAQTLFDLGGVQFGNFTVSESAVSSPVFVNPKVLISNPTALRVASKLMQQEINLAQSLRRARAHSFTVVAGVPVGGLLLATGHYRNGILLTPITADAVARLVLDGEVDPVIAPFGVERFRRALAAE